MTEGFLAWTAILLIAVTILMLRYSGFALMRRIPITLSVEVFLEKMSISVLVAIVATSVATGGIRTAAAVAIGMVVMLATRNATVAMVVGIMIGAIWTGFF